MKVSKDSMKFVFKRKESYIAFSFLLFFLILFSSTFIPKFNEFKGIRNFTSSVSIQQFYSNNSSIIYAVGEDNRLYYSFNKQYKGHLNTLANIQDLNNEYGDAMKYYYNFIQIDYYFPHRIIKVDGFRDNMNGNNGYTFVLDEIGNLYVLYEGAKQPLILQRNIQDFDIGYFNSILYHSDNSISYLIKKGNLFYRTYTENKDEVKFISTQGYKEVEENYVLRSYYVDMNNQLYQNEMVIDYKNLPYETIDTTVSCLKDIQVMVQATLIPSVSYNDEPILQLLSIENTTIMRTNQHLYGLGDSFYEEYSGILGIAEKLENLTIRTIPYEFSDMEYIYTTGPFALIVKAKDGFYCLGFLEKENIYAFQKIEQYGKIQYIIGSYNSVIVLKNKVLYRVEDGKLMNLYNHESLIKIIRYIVVFLLVMNGIYIMMLFFEETKKYNRYKNIEVNL